MTPELYTFKNLIGAHFSINGEDSVRIDEIIIPRIQRDYAQGRIGASENRVRERFLDALYESIYEQRSITLDFIYGDVEAGKLTLLDGQQRLTTLFLLYWYAAKKEKIEKQAYNFLKSFSYATRFSSRDFCKALVEEEINFCSEELSKEIENQAWYPFDWKNDPTIQSMLVMIDAINKKFKNIEHLWQYLSEKNLISFYFLPLEKMGLSDELYIKMNSRGKPLTDFEHFKAEFLEIIKAQSEPLYKEFSQKIDIDWTDILFPYRGENQIIDDKFMRYFKFISHILCYHNDIRPLEYNEFKLAKQLYAKENANSISNLEFLKSAFDCWYGIDIDAFFNSVFYTDSYECGKTKLYLKEGETTNLFFDCCNYHSEFANNGRNRLFSLNSILLFYAVVLYRQNITSITQQNFRRRIRIVRNLIENSQYEIREFDQYGNNQMQRLLNDVSEIILNGNIVTEDRGFNLLQKQEEQSKLAWLQSNSQYQEELFKLEDYDLLKGTISIVGLHSHQNFSKFINLFDNCDKKLISKALLCIGDYSQNLGWRTQLGVKSKDSVWADLFHPTKQRNEGNRFQNTSTILNQLLARLPKDTAEIQIFLKTAVSDYLNNSNTPKDWRYYFIKYEQMHYDTHGMYWWHDKKGKPYEIIIMHTGKALSGKNWNIFSYVLSELYPDVFELGNFAYQGDKLKIKNKNTYIEIFNDKVIVTKENQDAFDFLIPQNSDGIDLEDRIEKISQELRCKGLLS